MGVGGGRVAVGRMVGVTVAVAGVSMVTVDVCSSVASDLHPVNPIIAANSMAAVKRIMNSRYFPKFMPAPLFM
jgi:hypothetical protein